MDKATLPQPIRVDPGAVLLTVFNRPSRRRLAKQWGKRPDLPRQRKCTGASRAVPAERSGYAAACAQRRLNKLIAQSRAELAGRPHD